MVMVHPLIHIKVWLKLITVAVYDSLILENHVMIDDVINGRADIQRDMV